MAEYVAVDPPVSPGDVTNPKIATDRVTIGVDLVDVQRIKAGFGVDAAYVDVSASNPLPVTLGVASLGTAPARNTFGSVTSLAMAATASVVTFVADSVFKFRGVAVSGTGDGEWVVKYGASPRYGLRTHVTRQAASITLPNPDAGAASVTVTVEVTNLGTGVGDFVCTLLGE